MNCQQLGEFVHGLGEWSTQELYTIAQLVNINGAEQFGRFAASAKLSAGQVTELSRRAGFIDVAQLGVFACHAASGQVTTKLQLAAKIWRWADFLDYLRLAQVYPHELADFAANAQEQDFPALTNIIKLAKTRNLAHIVDNIRLLGWNNNLNDLIYWLELARLTTPRQFDRVACDLNINPLALKLTFISKLTDKPLPVMLLVKLNKNSEPQEFRKLALNYANLKNFYVAGVLYLLGGKLVQSVHMFARAGLVKVAVFCALANANPEMASYAEYMVKKELGSMQLITSRQDLATAAFIYGLAGNYNLQADALAKHGDPAQIQEAIYLYGEQGRHDDALALLTRLRAR